MVAADDAATDEPHAGGCDKPVATIYVVPFELSIASLPLILGVIAITFVAGFASGTAGLGLAVVLAAGLALVTDAKAAVLVLAIVNPLTAVAQVVHHRAHLSHARRILPIFIAGLVGVPFGVSLLAVLSSEAVALILGTLTLFFVLSSVQRARLKVLPQHETVLGSAIGFVGGIFNGAVGVAGPVLAMYLLALGLTPMAFAFLIQLLFLVLSSFRLVGLVAIGEITLPLWLLGLALLIPALAGQQLGFKLQRRLSQKVFMRVVLVVLFLSALALIRQGLGL